MLLWLILAAMTGLAALALLWPLTRAHPPLVPAADGGVGLYESQLAEIERDLARGLIGAAEAGAVKAEAARRLLRLSGQETPAEAASMPARARIASLLIVALVPLCGLGLYAVLGSPELPAQPLAARLSQDPAKLDITVALARIEQHLALDPADARGWDVVGPVYRRMGRNEDAARAYAAAIRHGGETAERLAGLGEARVAAADGLVTAEARADFEKALGHDRAAVKPRYFLALALAQEGRQGEALAAFRQLAADAPADAPWLPDVRQRIAGLEGGAALAALAPPEQLAAIRGMVQGLADRLAPGGGSLAEWSRLIRARAVLGEKAEANAALATARTRLAGADAAALDQLGRELGLAGGVAP